MFLISLWRSSIFALSLSSFSALTRAAFVLFFTGVATVAGAFWHSSCFSACKPASSSAMGCRFLLSTDMACLYSCCKLRRLVAFICSWRWDNTRFTEGFLAGKVSASLSTGGINTSMLPSFVVFSAETTYFLIVCY